MSDQARAPYDSKIEVRCYRTEKSRLQQHAEAQGVSTSELVRMQLGSLIGFVQTANAPETSPGAAAAGAESEPASAAGLAAPAAPPGEEPAEGGEDPAAATCGGSGTLDLVEWLAERTGAPRFIVRRQLAAGRVAVDGVPHHSEVIETSDVRRVTLDGEQV